jgi:phycocyanobilin lyase subunit beta
MTVPSPSPLLQPLLDKLNTAGTAEAVRFAVEGIAQARLVEAVPILIEVLGYNNPGAAVAAVDGLIALGEPAVMPLMELLDGFNYGARAWALRALAGIGDPRGIDLLVAAARDDFALSVRRAAARGVGQLHWQDFATGDRPPAQAKALGTLLKVCEDPEWVVRYAAVTGLEALGLELEPTLAEERPRLLACLENLVLQDEAPVLQARAQLALQRLGPAL